MKSSDEQVSVPPQRPRRSLWLIALLGVLLAELLAWWWLYNGASQRLGLGMAFWGTVATVGAAVVVLALMLRAFVRSRYQFSLRTLLLAVGVLGIGLGLLGRFLEWSREQRASVAKLTAAGARITYQGSGEPGLAAFFGRAYFQEAFHVRWNCGGEKPDLTYLHGLKTLQSVTLNGPSLSDSDLRKLQPLPRLMMVNLHRTTFSENALGALEDLPALTHVSLYASRVTDSEMASVGRLVRLRSLDLSETSIGDNGLRHLTGLSELVQLQLRNTTITDAGLNHLTGLANLEDLDLTGTNTTDRGLAYLAGLPKLRRLRLDKTKTSDAGVTKLQDSLPSCQIIR